MYNNNMYLYPSPTHVLDCLVVDSQLGAVNFHQSWMKLMKFLIILHSGSLVWSRPGIVHGLLLANFGLLTTVYIHVFFEVHSFQGAQGACIMHAVAHL